MIVICSEQCPTGVDETTLLKQKRIKAQKQQIRLLKHGSKAPKDHANPPICHEASPPRGEIRILPTIHLCHHPEEQWWLVDSSLVVTDIHRDPHGGGYVPCFSHQKDIYIGRVALAK